MLVVGYTIDRCRTVEIHAEGTALPVDFFAVNGRRLIDNICTPRIRFKRDRNKVVRNFLVVGCLLKTRDAADAEEVFLVERIGSGKILIVIADSIAVVILRRIECFAFNSRQIHIIFLRLLVKIGNAVSIGILREHQSQMDRPARPRNGILPLEKAFVDRPFGIHYREQQHIARDRIPIGRR